MTKTYCSLAKDELKLVELDGDIPVRLIDVGAHIRRTYANVTIGDLWQFAKAESKRRSRLVEAAFKKLEKRLGRRPVYQDRESAAEFEAVRNLPSWDSGKIARAGNLSQKLCDWSPDTSCGMPKYAMEVLMAIRYKFSDEIVALYFRRE